MLIKENVTLSLVTAILFLSFNVAMAAEKEVKDLKYFSNSMKSGELLGKSHGDAGLTCKDCHVNGTPKIANGTEKINLGDKLCLNCHDPESVNSKVIFKFKGHDVFPHSEHVGDIHCTDCHSMHQESILMCAECHVQPWMKTLPARWKQIK